MTQPGSGFGSGSSPGGFGGSSGGGLGPSEMPSILGGGPVPVPVGGGYRSPKKSGGGGLIALIAVAVLLLGGIVAVMVYVLSSKGGSIAADPSSLPPKQASSAYKHLPAGCDVVARANVAQMMELPAVKTHLVPVLDEIQASAASDPATRPLSDFVALTGVETKRDLKDVAVCMKGLSGPASQQKVLFVIGGDLRPETVVPALEKVDLRRRDKVEVAKVDGRLVARSKSGSGEPLIAGQAADGAILLSNDEALFASAASGSSAHESEYALPLGDEGAVTVGSAAMREAVSRGGPNPFLKDVNEITRAVAIASLAKAKIELRFVTTSAQAAKGLLDIYSLMLAPLVRQELSRAKGKAPGVDVLMNAKPTVDGKDFVLSAQGTPADVEAAMRELARILREKKAGIAL